VDELLIHQQAWRICFFFGVIDRVSWKFNLDCKYKFLNAVALLKPNGAFLFNPCNDSLKEK